MSHPNGKDIFPEKLLKQIQKYVSGKSVYIPAKETRKPWGETSGYKKYIFERNMEIKNKFKNGISIDDLSNEYFLSTESIKRIVYSKKEELLLSNCENFEIKNDALVKYTGDSPCVTLPETVKTINQSAFANCTALQTIVIPDHVTLLGYTAFQGCTNLSSITLPPKLGDIGCNTFRDCIRLAEIVIPDGVTLLGYSAFHGCENLSAVTIPAGVVSIGRGIFCGCEKLTSITYNGTRSQWEQIAKAPEWDLGMGEYTIQCADGAITG